MEDSQPPRRRYWIFRGPVADPHFKVKPGVEIELTLLDYREEMQPGDVAYLCRRDDDIQVDGWGTLTSGVTTRGDGVVDSSELPEFTVRVEFQHDVYPPLKRQDFNADRASELLSWYDYFDELGEELTEGQAAALNRLIRSRGGQAPPDPRPESKSGAEVYAPGPTLKQLLREVNATELVEVILKGAGGFASGRVRDHNRVTSSCLLFAAAEAGRDRGEVSSASDFLFHWLSTRHGAAYESELKSFRTAGGEAQGGGAEPVFTERSLRVVETAARLARQTRGEWAIRGRQLVGTLLLEAARGRVGAALRLKNMGVNLQRLLKDYFEFVKEWEDVGPEEEAKWHELLVEGRPLPGADELNPPEPPRPVLPRIDADDVKGEDRLGVMPEVRGFASIIAARDVKTPLSIGLFGDWGSGKSFFMSKLKEEVARIAGRVRAKGPGEESAFLGNIVQIDFNAWHYAEANLWASLVSHVFENLSLSDEHDRRKAEERKRLLLAQLDTTLGARREAESEVAARRREEESARAALERARREQTDAGLSLGRVLGREVWGMVREEVMGRPEVKDVLEDASRRLGREGLPANLGELRQEIGATRAAAGQAQGYLSAVFNDPRRWLKVFSILAATLLVPLLVTYALARWPLAETWGRVATSVAPVLTLLGGAAAWLRSRRGEVERVLSVLGEASRRLDAMYEAARAEHEREVRELRTRLDAKEAEVRTAAGALAEAERGVRETVAALRELEPGAVLERFVTERAASEDYRKLLGVVALIRRDFKKLSDLLGQQGDAELREAVRQKLLKDREQREGAHAGGESGPRPDEAEVERVLDEYRIDRIVLYIDDLDRCPPKQVVDVLQAIHLLLAFELFVVVVGVDARWVRHSLHEQFPALLGGEADEGDPHHVKAATPRDYIEKIFQVPFWLRPMGHEGSTDLLLGLIPDSELHPAGANGEEGPGAEEVAPRGANFTVAAGPEVARPRAGTGSSPRTPPPVAAGRAEEAGPAAPRVTTAAATGGASDGEGGAFALRPDNLLLEGKERGAMLRLAKVIGRTPRTLKRFVNVYRIIKAGLRGDRLEAFMGKGDDGEFRAVLILLALAHGAPDIAPAVFRELKGRCAGVALSGQEDAGLKAFLDDMKKTAPASPQEDWHRVVNELDQFAGDPAGDIPLATLGRWLPVVVRYTFQLGRMSEESS